MVLNVSSSTVLLVFVGFLMPLLLAHKSYFYGRGSYAFLNKSNVESIQGVSLTLILLAQVIQHISRPDLMLQMIGSLGSAALAVYLCLEGYELRKFSMYPKQVVRKRMLSSVVRLILMFGIGNLLMAFVHIYLGEEISLIELLRQTATLQFLDGGAALLIRAFLVFYLLCGLTKNLKVISLLGLVSGWPGIFVILGMWMARYQKVVFQVLKKQLLNISLISGILLLLSVKWNFLLPIVALLGTLVVLMKVQFKSQVFKLVNQFSIPLYVLQLPILYLVFYSSEPKNSALILVALAISLGVGILFKMMISSEFKQLKASNR